MFLIIGTGRSGTCWLGELISASPNVSITIEDKHIFPLVVKMATDVRTKTNLFLELVCKYKNIMESCGNIYVDKSHPNIWLVEDLLTQFPKTKFIGIQRDVFQTVSSMMTHGLYDWGTSDSTHDKLPSHRAHRSWEEYPLPNNFLGINEDNISDYKNCSPTSRCVYRWFSHYKRMNELKDKLGEKLCVISYDDLVLHHKLEIERLSNFIGTTIPLGTPNAQVLDKWKLNLSNEQIIDITDTLKGLLLI